MIMPKPLSDKANERLKLLVNKIPMIERTRHREPNSVAAVAN